MWWILDAFEEVTRGSENMVVGSVQVQLAARVVQGGAVIAFGLRKEDGDEGGAKARGGFPSGGLGRWFLYCFVGEHAVLGALGQGGFV